MANEYNKWTVDSVPRKYNILGNEKSYQFRFSLRSGFNERNGKGITVDEEKFGYISHLDPSNTNPTEAAQALLEFFEEHYILATVKSELKKLITFLKKTEKEDDICWYKKTIENLKKHREKLDKEIQSKENTLHFLIQEYEEKKAEIELIKDSDNE